MATVQFGRIWRKHLLMVIQMVVLVAIAAVFIYPFVRVFLSSLKDKAGVLANPWGFPKTLRFENFSQAWTQGNLGRVLFNSMLVTVSSVLITTVFAAPAAYYFTRVRFRGKLLYYPILLSMVIPTAVLIIPMTFLENRLGIVDTYWGLIMPYTALHVPLCIFILSNFFASLPPALEEAALIDGAARFQVLRHIVMPVSRPAVFAAMSLVFIFIWNEFTLALVVVTEPSLFTIPLGLKAFAGSYSYDYPLVFAALGIVNIVLIGILVFLQRHFVKGIVAGATKY